MIAFILTAGLGTRLKPLTVTTPKPCLPIVNRPLILRSMDTLLEAGVTSFGLNLHHLAEHVQTLILKSKYNNRTSFVHEPVILNTGGGIVNLWKNTSRDEEKILVVNGDIVFHRLNLREMVRAMDASGADVVLSVLPHLPGTTFLVSDSDGFFSGVGGGTGGWTFIGIQLISRELLSSLPERPFSIFTEGFFPMAQNGDVKILLHPFDGFWREAGTPGQYLEANLDFLETFGEMALPSGMVFDRKALAVYPQDVRPGDALKLDRAVIGERVSFEKPVTLTRCVVHPDTKVPTGIYKDHIFTPEYTIPCLVRS